MKATEASLLQFLKKSPQFVIPIYQRTYSWHKSECEQLWNDIVRAGSDENVRAHFVGTVVYVEQGLYHVSSQSPLLVIDGQQRLTTITLLLEALARQLGETEPVEGFSAAKIRSYYLVNPLESGDKTYKLLLTQSDRESLAALVQQRRYPAEVSLRIKQNFEFLLDRVRSLEGNYGALCKGISKLMIVDVSLSREQDNPQLIFESMNSTGRELAQSDLIRNFVLMGLEPKHQTELYEKYWRPMELDFGQDGQDGHFDSYMRHFLTVKTGEIPNVRSVYDSFKAYFRRPSVSAAGVDELLADVHSYAGFYCAMALKKEPNKQLSEAFSDLRELKVDTAYPLMLELYADYSIGLLSLTDFLEALRLIESYVFRRAICNIPTNSLNKTFANLGRSLQKDRYLDSLKECLLQFKGYRRFPDDDEFARELAVRDLYNFPRRSYWLRRLENDDHKERVFIDEYTIEHIMPQSENLPLAWQDELGPNWQRIHSTKLHSIGNLTLTGYNSEYSNKPFSEKRDMKGGFKESPLRLNKGLGIVERWDENAIDSRAERLATDAVRIWGRPNRNSIAPSHDRAQSATARDKFTLDAHEWLAVGKPMRGLFYALRKELLSLDPNVVEEVLKLYVAYKAETNFVDVTPQKNQLRLFINLPFSDLIDPRGLARDVSKIGHWGNGEVEVILASADDLPYVLGLVRQGLERQLGDDGELSI